MVGILVRLLLISCGKKTNDLTQRAIYTSYCLSIICFIYETTIINERLVLDVPIYNIMIIYKYTYIYIFRVTVLYPYFILLLLVKII